MLAWVVSGMCVVAPKWPKYLVVVWFVLRWCMWGQVGCLEVSVDWSVSAGWFFLESKRGWPICFCRGWSPDFGLCAIYDSCIVAVDWVILLLPFGVLMLQGVGFGTHRQGPFVVCIKGWQQWSKGFAQCLFIVHGVHPFDEFTHFCNTVLHGAGWVGHRSILWLGFCLM